MRTRNKKTTPGALRISALITWLTLASPWMQASTLTVTTLDDDSGPGSLRQTMAVAENGDRIRFSVVGSIGLTNGELLIAKDLVIAGPGADILAVDGNGLSRVFNIVTNTKVIISGLTISQGHALDTTGDWFCGNPLPAGQSGGGIYNNGWLVLSNCTIRNNTAGFGGQYRSFCGYAGTWGGSGGSGGGVYNANVLSATACTFSANSSGLGGNGDWIFFTSNSLPGATRGGDGGSGGAIFNQGAAFLTNCTVAGNNSGGGGEGGRDPWFGGALGGIGGSGGGIFNVGVLRVVACTIADNAAGLGGTNTYGHSIYPRRDGTAGGIYNGDGAEIINTIVANNNASVDLDVVGAFASLGHNLVGQTDGATGFTNGVNSDLVGTANQPVNPFLGQLQAKGGPTPTMALLPGSPALNAGDDNVVAPPYNITTDQRGFPRKAGPHVDIGAFEFDGCAILCTPDMQVCNDPGQCGATVHFAVPPTTNCGTVIVASVPPAGSLFPVGTNAVTWTAVDSASGQITNTCIFQVAVHDCEPPVIHSISASPALLWPPNHKMQPVTLSVGATDNCHLARSKIVSVTSNEGFDNSHRNRPVDWEITGDLRVNLRAERSGNGAGRVYTVTVECADDSANTSTVVTRVTVPR